MSKIIFSLFNDHPCLKNIADKLNYETGDITVHSFPDGESYIKFNNDIKNKDIIILESLDNPNNKILSLVFAAKTAKELGAKSIGLCAPYLSYMRQDIRFKEGEAITSVYFAKLLSDSFDWLVTVDPHLHRYKNLSEIYSIPSKTVHATSSISAWIKNNITNPLLIGPDSESEQWVSAIASNNNLPFIILQKTRSGDYDVSISQPDLAKYKDYTPVLIDDIISTGSTMAVTIKHLSSIGMSPPICIGVHAIFANDAYQVLKNAGAGNIITCNAISHISNKIDLSDILIEQLSKKIL